MINRLIELIAPVWPCWLVTVWVVGWTLTIRIAKIRQNLGLPPGMNLIKADPDLLHTLMKNKDASNEGAENTD